MRSKFLSKEASGEDIIFRDVLFAMFAMLAAILVILLLLPKEPNKSSDNAEQARGNIRVEIRWKDSLDVDVDLWGKAPNMQPVGYSHKTGKILALVRDDLGNYADITNLNYEVMFSRGLTTGEWVFNLHWFSNAQGLREIPITVIITITKNDTVGAKEKPLQVLATTIKLTHVNEERTIIRFNLDENGDLVKDSMSTLFTPLRSAHIPLETGSQ